MLNICPRQQHFNIQGELKVWIHPVKFSMDKDIQIKLRTPFMEIKVNVLVTNTTLPISSK